mmetsp:Transcript_18074/g.28297  ORF Transcript_18074/g.28297 Transcript_18074/m.28297 type:complete len:240 (-) Transcript_18074:54-773(-)
MSQYPMDDLDKQIAMLKREIDEKNDQKKTEKELSTTSYAVQGPMPTQDAVKIQEEKQENDSRSVFIRGLDWNTTSEEITEFLSECGEVERVTLLMDKFTQRPKGHAYVCFKDVEGASNAIATKNLALLRGRTLTIMKKRTNVPGMKRPRAPPMAPQGDQNAIAAAAATAGMMASMAQGMQAGAENPFMNFMSMMMRPHDAQPMEGGFPPMGRGGPPRGYGRGMPPGRGRGRGRGMPPYM